MNKIRLGISACLLGQPVRYDGQHKRDSFLTDTLANYVEYVPICPEVEFGLPIPREAMRLSGKPGDVRLISQKTREDLTEGMRKWTQQRLDDLRKAELLGFIFKSKSPSCGLQRVNIFGPNNETSGHASGLFAQGFTETFPLLPVEEEGRLKNPALRENFIEQIFTMKRYRDALLKSRSIKTLTDFHAENKYLLLTHSAILCRQMGRLLAEESCNPDNFDTLVHDYEAMLIKLLRRPATVKKHSDVLRHMMGHLKKCISSDEKQEFLETLEAYRQECVPLDVPMTLMKHYVRKYQIPYLDRQHYLDPHPIALKLRS